MRNKRHGKVSIWMRFVFFSLSRRREEYGNADFTAALCLPANATGTGTWAAGGRDGQKEVRRETEEDEQQRLFIFCGSQGWKCKSLSNRHFHYIARWVALPLTLFITHNWIRSSIIAVSISPLILLDFWKGFLVCKVFLSYALHGFKCQNGKKRNKACRLWIKLHLSWC